MGDRTRRRKQGLLPDILVEMASVLGARVVDGRTLFELKQLNCVATYFQKQVSKKERHAVEERAGRVHKDYCRSLHEVDRMAGTTCNAPRTRSNKCSYSKAWPDESHSTGGAERYLKSEFGAVQPLVFGHFGELNNRFLQLIDRLAESISNQHHRVHGWKSAKAGMCRAKVGVMRRISMAVLRETARHVTRGLDVVGPQCVQARTASRDQSTAAEADHDEGRHAIGSTDHTAGLNATISGEIEADVGC